LVAGWLARWVDGWVAACLIIRLGLCKMESTSNQKLVANSNIATWLKLNKSGGQKWTQNPVGYWRPEKMWG